MKIVKNLTALFISFLFITNVFAADIDISIIDIDSTNSNVLKVYFDKDIETNSIDLNSDIKLFKDLNISSTIRDLENDRLVSITLNNDLEKNTSYSLLGINPADGNIDFNINDLINGLEITGGVNDGIEKVNIIDSKNLSILFKNSLTTDDVDVKLLGEYTIDSINFNIDNKKELDIQLSDKLNNDSSFLIMIFSFTTIEEVIYNVSNSIYSFDTQILSDVVLEEPVVENIDEENIIDNVALNSATTPDTGTDTWLLLLFTFIVSSIIYFRKKA